METPIEPIVDGVAQINSALEQTLLNAYAKEKDKALDEFFGRERAILQGKVERKDVKGNYVNLDYNPNNYTRIAFQRKEEYNSFISEMRYQQIDIAVTPTKINGEYVVELPKSQETQRILNDYQVQTNTELQRPKEDNYTGNVNKLNLGNEIDDYLIWQHVEEFNKIAQGVKTVNRVLSPYTNNQRDKKATVLYGGEAVILNGKLLTSDKDVKQLKAEYDIASQRVADLKELKPNKEDNTEHYKIWKTEYQQAKQEQLALKKQTLDAVLFNDVGNKAVTEHNKTVAKNEYILNGNKEPMKEVLNRTERFNAVMDYGSTNSEVVINKLKESHIQKTKYEKEADIINKAIQDIKVYKTKLNEGYEPTYTEKINNQRNEETVHTFEKDFLNGKTLNTEPNKWVDDKALAQKTVKGGAGQDVSHTIKNNVVTPTISVAKAGIIGATMVTATVATGGAVAPVIVGGLASTAVATGLHHTQKKLEENLGHLKMYEVPSIEGEDIVQIVTPEMIAEANRTVLEKAKEKNYNYFDDRGRFIQSNFKKTYGETGISDQSAQMIFRVNSDVRQLPKFVETAEAIDNAIYRQEYNAQGSSKGYNGIIGNGSYKAYMETIQYHSVDKNNTIRTSNLGIVVSEGVLKDITEKINTEALVAQTVANHKIKNFGEHEENFRSLAREFQVNELSDLLIHLKDDSTHDNETFKKFEEFVRTKHDTKLNLLNSQLKIHTEVIHTEAIENLFKDRKDLNEYLEKFNAKDIQDLKEKLLNLAEFTDSSIDSIKQAISDKNAKILSIEQRSLDSFGKLSLSEQLELVKLNKEKRELTDRLTKVEGKREKLNKTTGEEKWLLTEKLIAEIDKIKVTDERYIELSEKKESELKKKEKDDETIALAKTVLNLDEKELAMLNENNLLKNIEKSFGIKPTGNLKPQEILQMNKIFLERASNMGLDLFEIGFGSVQLDINKLRGLTAQQINALGITPDVLDMLIQVNGHGSFGKVAFGKTANGTVITGFFANKLIKLVASEDGGEFINAVQKTYQGFSYAKRGVIAVRKLGNVRLSDLKNLRKTGLNGLKEAYNRKPAPRKRKPLKQKKLTPKQQKKLAKKTEKLKKLQTKRLAKAQKWENSFINRAGKAFEGAKKKLADSFVGKLFTKVKVVAVKALVYLAIAGVVLALFVVLIFIILTVVSSLMNALNPQKIIDNLLAPKTYEDTVAYNLYESLNKRQEKWLNKEIANFDKLFENRTELKYGNSYVAWDTYKDDFPAIVEDGNKVYINPFHKSGNKEYMQQQNDFTGKLNCVLTTNSNIYTTKVETQSGAKYIAIENGRTNNIKDIITMVDVMYDLDIDTGSDDGLKDKMACSPAELNWNDFKEKVKKFWKWIGSWFSEDTYGDGSEYEVVVKSVSYKTILNYALTLWENSHQEAVTWELEYYNLNNPYYYSDGTTKVDFRKQEVASRYGVCITPVTNKFKVMRSGDSVVPSLTNSSGYQIPILESTYDIDITNGNLKSGETVCLSNILKTDDENTLHWIEENSTKNKCWSLDRGGDVIHQEISTSDVYDNENDARDKAIEDAKRKKNEVGIPQKQYKYTPDSQLLYTDYESCDDNIDVTIERHDLRRYVIFYSKGNILTTQELTMEYNNDWDEETNVWNGARLYEKKIDFWCYRPVYRCYYNRWGIDPNDGNYGTINTDAGENKMTLSFAHDSNHYTWDISDSYWWCNSGEHNHRENLWIESRYRATCTIDCYKTHIENWSRNCQGHDYVYCGGHFGCKSAGVVYSITNEQSAVLAVQSSDLEIPTCLYYEAYDYNGHTHYEEYKLEEHGYDTIRPKYYTENVDFSEKTGTVVKASQSGGCASPATDIQGSYTASHGMNYLLDGNVWGDGIEGHGTNECYFSKDIFDIDCYLDKGQNIFPFKSWRDYRGWNEDNMTLVLLKATINWKELYQFDIQHELGEYTLAEEDIENIISNISENVTDNRRYALEVALSWVGRGHYSEDHTDHAFLTTECRAHSVTVRDSDGVAHEVRYGGNCTAGNSKDFIIYYINMIYKNENKGTKHADSDIFASIEFDGLGNTMPSPADIICIREENEHAKRLVLPVKKSDFDNVDYVKAQTIDDHYFGEQYVIYVGKTKEEIKLTTGATIPKDSYITVDMSKYGKYGTVYMHYLKPSEFKDTYDSTYNYWWMFGNRDGDRAKVMNVWKS